MLQTFLNVYAIFFLFFNGRHLNYIRFNVVSRCRVAIKHKQEVIKTHTHTMGREDVSVLGRLSDLVLDVLFLAGRGTTRLNYAALWPTPRAARAASFAFSCLGCSDTVMPRVAERLCSVPEYPNPESSRASSASTYSTCSTLCPAV